MRAIWTVVIFGTLVALPACASRNQVSQTESNPPTVSYHYDDDEDYDRVLERAEAHCSDNYGRDAVLINRDRDGDDYEATFRCDE